MRVVCWWLPLQATDDGGQRAHDLRVLAVAFVASPPPRIPTDLACTRDETHIKNIPHRRHQLIRTQEWVSISLTATQGAKVQWMPVARTSSAVASPILRASSASL